MFLGRILAGILGLLAAAGTAGATDEIQVYNAEINEPGRFSLQLHGNYVPSGRTTPDFPGGIVPDGATNGTPELAYGVTDFWEVGCYLPWAVTRDGDFEWGGAKLRTLFVSPRAAGRRFFYGLNIELSYATPAFSGNRWNSELRPIVGWRGGRVEFILNPILEVPLNGPDRTPAFSPATRLAAILSPAWSVGLEHYAEFGPVNGFLPADERLQELFLVGDYSGKAFDADFGAGRGLTSGSDDWTFKAILGWSF